MGFTAFQHVLPAHPSTVLQGSLASPAAPQRLTDIRLQILNTADGTCLGQAEPYVQNWHDVQSHASPRILHRMLNLLVLWLSGQPSTLSGSEHLAWQTYTYIYIYTHIFIYTIFLYIYVYFYIYIYLYI